VGLLSEDGSRAMLLLQEHGGVEEPGPGAVKFLPELDDLGSLAVIVDGHWRWWCCTPSGGAAHQRCSGRREGDKPLGLERSERKKPQL
jgi:hypothetical protein